MTDGNSNNKNDDDDDDNLTAENLIKRKKKMKKFQVSGRDDTLLKVLARKMNFKFEYVDVKMLENDENVTMPGALGLQLLQRRVRGYF